MRTYSFVTGAESPLAPPMRVLPSTAASWDGCLLGIARGRGGDGTNGGNGSRGGGDM
ncbi:hypothetical protein [Streptomyces sp. NPDC002990]